VEPGKEIKPVRTANLLFALGREQRNCVGSYVDRAAEGKVFIYRVCIDGEVGTLSLVWGRDGVLRIDQFKAACNRTPSPVSEFAVRRWFDDGRAAHQEEMPIDGGQQRSNKLLPEGVLPGVEWGTLRISPLRDQVSLLRYLPTWATVEFYTQPAKQNRFYEVVTPEGGHLVVIRPHPSGYRLTELRGSEGRRPSGQVLMQVGEWLGRMQKRYR
jgi:hypothetical protein